MPMAQPAMCVGLRELGRLTICCLKYCSHMPCAISVSGAKWLASQTDVLAEDWIYIVDNK